MSVSLKVTSYVANTVSQTYYHVVPKATAPPPDLTPSVWPHNSHPRYAEYNHGPSQAQLLCPPMAPPEKNPVTVYEYASPHLRDPTMTTGGGQHRISPNLSVSSGCDNCSCCTGYSPITAGSDHQLHPPPQSTHFYGQIGSSYNALTTTTEWHHQNQRHSTATSSWGDDEQYGAVLEGSNVFHDGISAAFCENPQYDGAMSYSVSEAAPSRYPELTHESYTDESANGGSYPYPSTEESPLDHRHEMVCAVYGEIPTRSGSHQYHNQQHTNQNHYYNWTFSWWFFFVFLTTLH